MKTQAIRTVSGRKTKYAMKRGSTGKPAHARNNKGVHSPLLLKESSAVATLLGLDTDKITTALANLVEELDRRRKFDGKRNGSLAITLVNSDGEPIADIVSHERRRVEVTFMKQSLAQQTAEAFGAEEEPISLFEAP